MERSYFLTMLLLVLHQIDAAFWREWELFFLPGGVQGFLLFNALVIPVLMIGYRHVLLGTSRASFFAKICAGLGTLTFVIHAGLALAGAHQFHLPASIAVIILCLISSIWLLVNTRNHDARLADSPAI
ncbi:MULTISPECIES: DUF6713 family protein [Pseudomonas]|uniref:Uncharacterized protein n=1 Tax=Pseudomonas costantinii TaxID=168469 RepID=A0A1S2V2F6_9PSED|nr:MULTISPECIES: DUF6713 family protein [Pseudomonas]OIN44549.1 hypothetical protein BFL40_30135 [Pseudomonas costantinii]OIN46016.1 hypothetical protein BFL40_27670 [Pseudomonas costantinii]OIN52931.1 hypothetical protein BFL40_12590 [Pseudomonas costantinii]OIN53377.1 hypothetical protein BFL40_10460 [Pseudomonas costantinii]SED27407.1 hypothetical protein SAMN04515675_0521 [Pseudomonas costantinii]